MKVTFADLSTGKLQRWLDSQVQVLDAAKPEVSSAIRQSQRKLKISRDEESE